ncbi:MAG: response regulator transcription factor [Hyphomicrobium sp.]|jgi:DNA-binding CsgD family transcriptional regulator|nr:response regulator transcription factor [Hyphomicrobium sp.]
MTDSSTEVLPEATLPVPRQLCRPAGHANYDAVKNVAALTPKQRQVFSFLSFGFSNKEIAAMMGVAESTIKAHVCAIFRVFRCVNRSQAALIAFAIRQHMDPTGIIRRPRTATEEEIRELSSAFENMVSKTAHTGPQF